MPAVQADAPPAGPADALADWCIRRLETHEGAYLTDPLANSVRRLAHDLLEAESAGALTRRDLAAAAGALADRALARRAATFRTRHAPTDGNRATYRVALAETLSHLDIDAARERLERPRVGAVFTAHPTFSLSPAARAAFQSDETDPPPAAIGEPHAPSAPPTLEDEHEQALAAIARAQAAIRARIRDAIEAARACFPDRWREISPAPLTLATWVGYDLDGRTDIHWGATIRFRLAEKARQLDRYASALRAAAAPMEKTAALAGRLEAAAAHARGQAALFAADLSDASAVTAAANALTAAHGARLTRLQPVIEEIEAMARDCTEETARIDLLVLRAEMRLYGLGVAHIHLRINAAQIASALRAELGLDTERDILDRSVLEAAAAHAAGAALKRINFASLFREQMTARRQMMICAEILKHIDEETPIRFLIAESEAPATVMGALYLARLYGVDGLVDISPLFETPDAIERGGRFMERLLSNAEFRAYVRQRGRVSIQTGFSDSGRFMGQAAANLAIERLQILFARALTAKGLGDLEAVIFNTHGESLGRGGFPGSLNERFDYLMTPWARARFAKEKIRLKAESSFQGGDGFLHFDTDGLAAASVNALALWALEEPSHDEGDRYYSDINYSWDVYRGVKAWQERLFANPDYERAIAAFGPSLLIQSGSRKVRRPKDAAAAGLRALRAIPHNAILQQLAVPANVWGGLGAAAGAEADRLADLVRNSARIRGVMTLVRAARAATSVPALRAYAAIFDPGFWISKAAGEKDAAAAWRSAEIARHLSASPVAASLDRLANLLSADLLRLDRMLAELDGEAAALARRRARRGMHALHAIRQALIMRAWILIAGLPAFSSRHDATRESVFDLAFELKFDALADLLAEIFPAAPADGLQFAGLEEPADDLEDQPHGYPEIHATTIGPLREIAGAIREISVGLSHEYEAFG